ncbi:NAD-dependent epimerase/dehydratase family protein [Desulfosudis oleivorans]|uniref:3-beta hydroxysteroid dehydrogenase/isomerase n=1 Tax=Desulfosudis oleivorans (strain DSM 6200 / JCM 39069 / Hxd3) TaxID=96561 RepID=A8ZWT0_DESOH|nr:NAD-dependent epimerase/dehydratase family protein [Desulfosudis oleivorans]ABW68411.1 3-beta hydroxysteroid dehydrogenase/isomerase [Desulfosudis oleivorans Hxd3]
MKAVVTGGGGFLAGHLIDKLVEAGHSVRTVELPGRNVQRLKDLDVEIVTGDLCDPSLAARACEGMDVVFNPAALAAPLGPWKRFWSINVELVDNVIAGCKKSGVRRLVHVSSPSAVFDGSDHFDADETLPFPKKFLNYYCATKAESEKRVLAANGTDLETVAIRPHAIWGPRDRTLFPRIIERAKSRRLVQVGDGTNIISTLYVENGADALILAATADRAPGNVYFVTDNDTVNLWGFLRRILNDLGLPPIRARIPYPLAYTLGATQEVLWTVLKLSGEPTITRYSAAELAKNHSYSIDRARTDLGYEPTVSREEGLQRFYEWVRNNLL